MTDNDLRNKQLEEINEQLLNDIKKLMNKFHNYSFTDAENGILAAELAEGTSASLKAITVFDVSQTAAKELPDALNDLRCDLNNYDNFVKYLIEISVNENISKELDELKASLDAVQTTANNLISKIDEKLLELKKDQEKANPLKTVEELVEQNYNSIDGIINNEPPPDDEHVESVLKTLQRNKEKAEKLNSANPKKASQNISDIKKERV